MGLFFENLYKLPDNQLIVANLSKSCNSNVYKSFIINNESEQQENDENLDCTEIVGTIKFIIDFVGFNHALIEKKNWINSI